MKKSHTKKLIQEAIAYWKKQLANDNCPSRQVVSEGKIADFFGKLFKTKKFLAALKEVVKQKNYSEHPLMKVADEMRNGPFFVKFTNVDIENDGYPIDVSARADCIAVKIDRSGSDKYDNIADRESDIMSLAKKCGLPDGYKFYAIDNSLGVIADIRGMHIVLVNEASSEFEKIDDIVKYLAGKKDLKWIKVYKFLRLEASQSNGGEEVETVGSDGNVETKRTAKKGDWIVNNVSNKDNKWIIDDKTFKKKYEEDKDGIYKPKGGPMLAAKVADCTDHGVEFAPPNWGGDTIKIMNDGWFVKDPTNEKDIYAISKKDFDATYKPVGKSLNEVQHDGLHTPKYPTRRNETDKPTIYYIGVDEYSDNFSDYGHYIMPNGSLTQDASNSNFKSAAVTRVPAALKSMVDKALAKYGKDHYIFVFKEEYSYGTLTHKRHARPSVMDIWYPNGLYWRYGLQPIEQLSHSQDVNEAAIDIPDSKIAPIMDLVIETPLDNGVNIHIETDDDGIDIVQEIVSILKNGIHRRFPNKIDGVDFVHFYAK